MRLALYAEIMKGKAWTPATLKEVGGTTGVGVTFLEETFNASTSPPEHRHHQTAARAVLKALLPDSGTDIKGEMTSRDELLAASGYANRPKDFDDLIRILDNEIRLITSTDPEGVEGGEWRMEGGKSYDSTTKVPAAGRVEVRHGSGAEVSFLSSHHSPFTTRYYQLTHDFLIPSLRDWLTPKQRETRKGRAELTLDERSAFWIAKQENKQWPTVTEWLSIRTLTESKRWTESQRAMMQKALRLYAWLTVFAVLFLAVLFQLGFACINSGNRIGLLTEK